MLLVLKKWVNRYFSHPEAVLLTVILLGGICLVGFASSTLMPVFLSITISYLLLWWCGYLTARKVPYKIAYILVYVTFMAFFVASLVFLMPLLWRQLANLVQDLPVMLQSFKITLKNFLHSSTTVSILPEQLLDTVTASLVKDVQSWGKKIFAISLTSIPGVLTWMVYLVLVPLLVFFFLKDRDKIIGWFVDLLPDQHSVLVKVWREMDQQIGNYIRGKITEIIIVGFSTYMVFWYFNLRYQILLAVLVGLSVVIPYIGAVLVTIPVVLIAYLQWGLEGGLTGNCSLLLAGYFLIQMLDGNLLVPFLFSEAVNLHPVAIILAILIFGAIWGFWGIFFAIPLATLVKAVIYAWPTAKDS